LTQAQENNTLSADDTRSLEKVSAIFLQALVCRHAEVVAKVKDGKLVYLDLTVKVDLAKS